MFLICMSNPPTYQWPHTTKPPRSIRIQTILLELSWAPNNCPKKHYIVCSTLSFRPQAFAILAFCYSSSATFKYSSYISLTNSHVCNFRQTRGVQTGHHIDAYISHRKIHPQDDTTRQGHKAYVLSGTHEFHWVFKIAFTTEDSFVEDRSSNQKKKKKN